MHCIKRGFWAVGIPLVISMISVIKQSVLLFGLFVVAHFVVVRIFPAFKHRESIWMFIMVALSSIPINIYILILLNEWGDIFNSWIIVNIFRYAMCYIVLLSMEELIMGVITRLIWRRQYKALL